MFRASRIACLRIPAFPIAAHRRSEEGPAVAAAPVGPAIVVRGDGSRARVAALSGPARGLGIARGMTAADARALCAGLREWRWSPDLYDRVGIELAAALLSATPRVARRSAFAIGFRRPGVDSRANGGRSSDARGAPPGTFWLDADGWERRGGERAFVEAVRATALVAGHPEARVGLADTAVAAWAAARCRGRAVVRVRPGGAARFLAPLPLRALPISGELLGVLHALGLERVGALAALDPAEVEGRLGAEGVRAHRLARGLDEDGPPDAGRPVEPRAVEVELPGPTGSREPLIFLLKSCLDRLSKDLASEGLCARVLEWSIETEEGPVTGAVRPARPTRRVPLLLEICRSALERAPWPGRALGLRVEVVETAAAAAEQADLFEPPRPDPDALVAALTRLRGRWGRGAVVRPAAADSHRPERAGRWEPVDLEGPASSGRACETADAGALNAPLAPVLRLWASPRPVAVRIEDGRPGAVELDGEWRRVDRFLGPERLSGDWWADPYRREYYRVTIASGDLLWLFYDPRDRRWFWHGWWD